jgi:competence protein ComEA
VEVRTVVVDAGATSTDLATGDGTAVLPDADFAGAGGGAARERVGRLVERWLPGGLLTDRGRPGPVALSAIAAVAALAAAAGVWLNRPVVEAAPALPLVSAGSAAQPGAVPGSSGRSAAAATGAAGPSGERGQIVVSVVGRVARPGLVTLPEGARVADALQAVGGALPGTDLAALNLARRLSDGEQVAVGVPVAAPAAGPEAGPAPGAPPGKVDLNTATVAQLDALPGVGPVTAQRIVQWRTQHGRFARIDQLRDVDGIGDSRFDRLKDLVQV